MTWQRVRPPSAEQDTADSPDRLSTGSVEPSTTALLALQNSAGNQAVQRVMVQREPNQSTTPGEDPRAKRVKSLHDSIHGSPPLDSATDYGENLFDCIHRVRSFAAELEADYQKEYGISVKDELLGISSVRDSVRAYSYWRFGVLRPADKLFFALYGNDFDLETTRRILIGLKDDRDETDRIFNAEFGKHFEGISPIALPDGRLSLIAAVLESKLLKKKTTTIEINALLAFGEVRLVDQLAIAYHSGTMTVPWEAVLAVVQKAPDKPALRVDFEKYYREEFTMLGLFIPADISDIGLLDNKHAYLVATLLWKGEIGLNQRIRLALKFSDDMGIVFDWIKGMSPEEKAKLRQTQLDEDYMREMDEDDRKRLMAMLAENPTAVQRLQAAGADDSTKILKCLQEATGDDRKMFADSLRKGKESVGDEFVDLLVRKLGGDFGKVDTILTGSLDARLRLAMQGMTDDEDYVFALLENHATLQERTDILRQNPKDTATVNGLMKDKLSTKEYLKALRLLLSGAEGMDAAERANLAFAYSKEELEAIGFVDKHLNVFEAFKDEQRELRWATEDAPREASAGPEQAAKLNAASSGVLASAEALVKTRDNLNDYAAQVIGLAVGTIIAYFTAGAGAVAIAELMPVFSNVAVRVGVSAIARGVARVSVQRVTKGSGFDVFGADGANAFTVGAVDGIVEVIAPSVLRGLVSKEYQDAMVMQGRKAAEEIWEGQKALHIKTALLEGASTEGFSSMVEATGTDETWRKGLSEGVMTVLAKGAQGGALAAGGFAGIEVASPFLSKIVAGAQKGLQKLVQSGMSPEVARGLVEKEGIWIAARTGRHSAVGDVKTHLSEAEILKELQDKGVKDVDHAMRLIRDERKFIKEYNEMRKANSLPVWEDNMFAQPPGELLAGSLGSD